MSDEGKLSQAAAKGARASALIENDILSEAFKALEDTYTAAWRTNVPATDMAGRERLFQAINIVGLVRDHLTAVINNGKLAAADLKELAETERKKRFGII